jgi:hypothetical protein
VTGKELEVLTEAELALRVRTATVFTRIMPEQKLRIVNALKSNGPDSQVDFAFEFLGLVGLADRCAGASAATAIASIDLVSAATSAALRWHRWANS